MLDPASLNIQQPWSVVMTTSSKAVTRIPRRAEVWETLTKTQYSSFISTSNFITGVHNCIF
jgi:hypothetical protein